MNHLRLSFLLLWVMGFLLVIMASYFTTVIRYTWLKYIGFDKYRKYILEDLTKTHYDVMKNEHFLASQTTLQNSSLLVDDFKWKRLPAKYRTVYPYDYKYVINEPHKCLRKIPFLILCIFTRVSEFSSRHAIRKTWGNESLISNATIARLFFMGIPKFVKEPLNKLIKEESETFHDIIQVDYLDTYNNLTLKTMTAMKWFATYCPNASYIMKIDSDMFLNIEYLIYGQLKPHTPMKTNYFTGFAFLNFQPIRDKNSKWYMPNELYSAETYPTFCSGTGYLLSGDLPKRIVEVSSTVRPIYLEDVYIGLCLDKLKVKVIASYALFHINHVEYFACSYAKLITSHHFDAFDLLKTWDDFQRKKGACAT
ncbi:beta-1,3-galactosyltransferase 2-like [Protopterus annectens]|uniref:beta-1,3-galactosyltransferase 2-like n=1 Tax=Protopterus annectens TaxID=7888 RepID=UPI001CFB006D|nr:beta-1,3-galactosyltransferase 2-like [Protopterus annectens]XP_043918038.1 beta-1,3-galactosyltransferase 2-like [Protopterus annectens]